MIKYGVLGTGYFGAYLARTLHGFSDAAVIAVHSPGESSIKLSKELGCKRYEKAEDLIADSEVDAVIVASPNFAHYEHVLLAAKAKKLIFCEKPFALSIAHVEEMLATCKKNNVMCMVGHVMHYYKASIKVKNLIDQGLFGNIINAHVERTGWEEPKKDVSWKKRQNLSGGHLFHHIHEIDLLQWFMGPVKEVYSVADNLGHKGEGWGDEDDVILLSLTFQSGALASMQYGSGFQFGNHFIRLNGTKGGAVISFQDNQLILKIEDEITVSTLFEDTAGSVDEAYRNQNGGIRYGVPGMDPPAYLAQAIAQELRDFHQVVGGQPIPERIVDLFDGSSALQSVAIASAAQKSQKQQVPIILQTEKGRGGIS